MTVEAATKVEDLNASYPASGDSKSEGDDHMRLIKSCLLYTFAGAASTGVTGFNVYTQAAGNNSTLAASTSFVSTAIAAQVLSATLSPGTNGQIINTAGGVVAWTNIKTVGGVSLIGTGDIAPPDMVGFRNKIVNGDFRIDQVNAGASHTVTAGAALAATVDPWYEYCTGANVTAQQVAGPVANTYRYKFTGAASVTGIGFGTRMEAKETAYMASASATFQSKLSSSSLTSITWTMYYANTTDTFGTLASPTRTQIATGTFTINSTEATYSTTQTLPAAATTGIEVVLTGGALLSTQTLTIGDVSLEPGTTANSFERRAYPVELSLCRYHYRRYGGGAQDIYLTGYVPASGQIVATLPIEPPMRTAPTGAVVGTWNVLNSTSQPTVNATSQSAFTLICTANVGVTNANQSGCRTSDATTYVSLNSRLF